MVAQRYFWSHRDSRGVSQTHLLTRIRFYASSMTSSFTSDSALSLGRIDRMCVRCTAVKLGRLWITGGLPTPLLFHAIWDRTSILSFSVATRAATRALPPKFRGVCWSTGLLYRPPWWQLILLICHRLIDSCHYSVCKRETTGLLLITQVYRDTPWLSHLYYTQLRSRIAFKRITRNNDSFSQAWKNMYVKCAQQWAWAKSFENFCKFTRAADKRNEWNL